MMKTMEALIKHPQWQRTPGRSPHLTLFLHDQGLAVYSWLSDTLYGFETDAAALFLRLEEGVSHQTIMDKYAGGHSDKALASLLLQCEPIVSGRELRQDILYAAALDYPERVPANVQTGKTYRLLDTLFQVCSDVAGLTESAHASLSHLECLQDEAEIIPDIVIELKQCGASIALLFNGEEICRKLPPRRVYPFLQDHMRITAYQRTSYLLTLHAAALYKDDKTILLPGASGAGKSTLAAALLAEGYQLLSDETAVIKNMKDNFHLCPVPMPLGLKQASWKLLDSHYPSLRDATIHHRFDEKHVKYLNPWAERESSPPSTAATHIIFPQVISRGDGTLTPLTPLAALAKLDDSGYQVQDALGVDKAASILEWLTGLDAYQLSYSHFDQAVATIEGL